MGNELAQSPARAGFRAHALRQPGAFCSLTMPPVTVSVDGQEIGSISWSEVVFNGENRYVLDNFSVSTSEYEITLTGRADPFLDDGGEYGDNVGLRYSFKVTDRGLPNRFALIYTVPFVGEKNCPYTRPWGCFWRGDGRFRSTVTDARGDGVVVGYRPYALLTLYYLSDDRISGGAVSGYDLRYRGGRLPVQHKHDGGYGVRFGPDGTRAAFVFTLSGGDDAFEMSGLMSETRHVVPEPTQFAIVGVGLSCGVAMVYRRRKTRTQPSATGAKS